MSSSASDSVGAVGFRRLFEPITIGTFTVRNRIVSPTHGTRVSEARDLRFLQERARGGCGLFGLGAGAGAYAVGPDRADDSDERGTLAADGRPAPAWDVTPPSPVSRRGIEMYDASVIPFLRKRADVIHAEGAHCYAQVAHGGAADHWPQLQPLLGPSNVPDPYEGAVPHALSSHEIADLVLAFAHGVRRAKESGADAAELHGAHGYLIAQFLSPYFNQRRDAWGGTLEKRARILVDILAAARAMVGAEFPIGVRLGCEGGGERRGLTVEELTELAALLSPQVAWISVSNGNYSGLGDGFETAYLSPWYKEPAFNAPVAAAVKAVVDVPVFVTGRIVDPSIAESILAEGAADMVGMVRALIADPELPQKAREGRADEVRMCLGLSECHHAGEHRVPMTCAVNAAAAREAEMEIRPAEVRKTVVVVGAGPAGMEAARVAALRGHHVYLCDAERELGGTIRILALDPNRRNLRDHAAYFEPLLKRLGVELVLGNVVGGDELVEFEPDAVVVATGGRPLIPHVEGIDGSNAVTALDVLRGVAQVGRNVLVVGGRDTHLGAPTVAELLADQGSAVEMICEHVDFARSAEDATRFTLLQRLKRKGVRISMATKLDRLHDGDAVVTDTFAGRSRRIEGVTVVLACGTLPNDRLARELEGRVPTTFVVGDALAPRRLMHATIEGARAGLRV